MIPTHSTASNKAPYLGHSEGCPVAGFVADRRGSRTMDGKLRLRRRMATSSCLNWCSECVYRLPRSCRLVLNRQSTKNAMTRRVRGLLKVGSASQFAGFAANWGVPPLVPKDDSGGAARLMIITFRRKILGDDW